MSDKLYKNLVKAGVLYVKPDGTKSLDVLKAIKFPEFRKLFGEQDDELIKENKQLREALYNLAWDCEGNKTVDATYIKDAFIALKEQEDE